LFEELEINLLNQIFIFWDFMSIYEEKIKKQPPGSGPAGLQVNSGQVKTKNF
jgi:hypothetical protein